MTIRTTDDWLSWSVDTADYKPSEVLDYVNNLKFNTNDVRTLVVGFVDKIAVVNGIPVVTNGKTAQFDSVTQAYAYNGSHRVRAFHYWSDKDLVMVEYLADHPSAPSPRNTEHSSAEFGDFFSKVFEFWQSSASTAWQILADVEARDAEMEANPTFVSTQEKVESL